METSALQDLSAVAPQEQEVDVDGEDVEVGASSGSSTTHVSDLPRDVLLEVLSFVPAADLVMSAARVSREWRELAADAGAWVGRRLRVSPRAHRPLSLAERAVLRRAPRLRALAVSLRRLQDLPPLSALLPSCARLRELQLQLPNLTARMARDACAHWPQLETLLVDASRVEAASLAEVGRLKDLRHFQLSSFQEDAWGPMLELRGCARLRSLQVDAPCPPGTPGPARVLDALRDRLSRLHLGTLVPASDDILTAIGGCSRLQWLHLEDCSALSDRGLLSLCGLRLERLSLRGAKNISHGALQSFLHRADLSGLQLLDLGGCHALTDDVLRLLRRRCHRLPTIVAKDCPRVSQRCYESLYVPATAAAPCSALLLLPPIQPTAAPALQVGVA